MVPDIHMTLFRFVDAGLMFQLEAPNETRTPTQWIVTIICAIRWIPPSLRELLRTGVLSLCFSFYFNFVFGETISEKHRKKLVEFCLPCTDEFTYVSDSVFCLIAILVILTLYILMFFCAQVSVSFCCWCFLGYLSS